MYHLDLHTDKLNPFYGVDPDDSAELFTALPDGRPGVQFNIHLDFWEPVWDNFVETMVL